MVEGMGGRMENPAATPAAGMESAAAGMNQNDPRSLLEATEAARQAAQRATPTGLETSGRVLGGILGGRPGGGPTEFDPRVMGGYHPAPGAPLGAGAPPPQQAQRMPPQRRPMARPVAPGGPAAGRLQAANQPPRQAARRKVRQTTRPNPRGGGSRL
jgi:hypothetical protein